MEAVAAQGLGVVAGSLLLQHLFLRYGEAYSTEASAETAPKPQTSRRRSKRRRRWRRRRRNETAAGKKQKSQQGRETRRKR